MFRRLLPILLAVFLTAPVVHAERDVLPLADYTYESWFLPQTPGLTAGPAGSLFNPAAWAMTDQAGADFWWNDRSIRSGLDNYGLAFGRHLNFAYQAQTFGTRESSYKIYDYQLGLAGGTRAGTFGMSYRWARGETQRTPRQQTFAAGFVSRRHLWSTFGASGTWSLESSAAQYVFDLGIRPFGRQWLTLFADWAVNNDHAFFQDGSWGAGVEVRPVSGIHLGFKARERVNSKDVDYSVILGVTLHDLNFTGMPVYDNDNNRQATSFLIRTHPPFPGLPVKSPLLVGKRNLYAALSLENKYLTYQKYQFMDSKRVAWLDLLPVLDGLRDDDNVKIVALNLAGFKCRPSLAWELRQKLMELQQAGKEVIIHVDRVDPMGYYLVSVADRITMDPQGMLSIPGIGLSRSYLKGTLEKLGLGFQEWRYFKYKSAAETLSRDSMSEADREQRQRIVDVIYEEIRSAVTSGRQLSDEQFDALVDDKSMLLPSEAVAAGLVDATSRWDQLGKWMSTERHAKPASGALSPRLHRTYWDEQWSEPLRIPVVYAVGGCDMDTGIKGRTTSEYLRSLIRDPHVVAVVLRADSPGGDPLPSDLVADAVRQLNAAGKPVIVSQGDVAASGGYWISMDGAEVLTTPVTITGSIGVIGGWLWDDGFTGKLGITSQEVHRGAHADLFASVGLPLFGSLPRRAMDEDELARVKEVIMTTYHDFVKAVATGRNMSEDAVAAIAQGRVWMGGDAIDNGLCDRFGSLSDALDLAREKAGIADWREVKITEYPPRPWIQWPTFGPQLGGMLGLEKRVNRVLARLYGLDTADGNIVGEMANLPDIPVPALGLSSLELEYLRTVGTSPGRPVMMIGPDVLPEQWRELD